jgi:hypothetical protein
MYCTYNFKTKRDFKDALKNGMSLTLYAPSLGQPKENGPEFVEGPHYPEPHKWYAEVEMKDGKVIKIK